MKTEDVIVSFRGVRKTYDGETLVVKQLDLDIYQGEFLTLLGPSGSGKTTCLMMLAGFEFPTGGEIWLDGQLLNNVPPHKRNIGMVFQNYALFPHLTVEQNVAYPLTVRKLPADERAHKVNNALKMVRMEGFAKRYPSQLSGGQQQRIALARALVFQPKLVLMDEPLGALDKRLRETMQYEIMRLHRELSLTIVYVTHDQAEALTMSDRVAVFSDGRIQQAATPSELYENAQNAFVANFVGENNGLTGRVVDVSDTGATLALADGSLIRGRCESGLCAGDDAMLALRPERAHIPRAEGTQVDAHSNVVRARVEELVYCGDHHRVHLKLGSHDHIVVKVPNTQRHALPSPGDTVEVAWRHDDCKILAMTARAHRNAPVNYSPPSPLPSIMTTAPAGAN